MGTEYYSDSGIVLMEELEVLAALALTWIKWTASHLPAQNGQTGPTGHHVASHVVAGFR